MIGADIDRIEFRHLRCGEGDGVGGETKTGLRRKDIGAARQIFLDDVVLGGALQLFAGYALLIG